MRIIGHRGAAGLAPENTLAAVSQALDCGVDEIEVDIRVTRDSQAILFHDKYIVIENKKKYIAQTNLSELLRYKPDIALLSEVIDSINRVTPLILEIKQDVELVAVTKLLNKYLQAGWSSEDFIFTSFNQSILLKLRTLFPSVEIIVLESYLSIKAVYRARQLRTRRISMNQKYIWFGFVRNMARAGYLLSCYTLNDPKKANKWARHGLYGVMTDYPDRFRDKKI